MRPQRFHIVAQSAQRGPHFGKRQPINPIPVPAGDKIMVHHSTVFIFSHWVGESYQYEIPP